MATTRLTPNIKLRITSDLTADSRYNLQTIDSLGSVYQVDTNSVGKMRSKSDILIQTNDPDIGGTGSGGTVTLGSADQPLGSLVINAASISMSAPLSLLDSAVGGTKSLLLNYKSDANGAADVSADRTLNIDTEGADRSLVIGSNLSILTSDLSLTMPTDIAWTLPNGNGASGQVLTTDGLGTLSWTDATATALSGLSDVQIAAPSDGQTLQYNSTSGQWENATTVAAVGAETAFVWEPADGNVKTIVHGLGTQQILATVIDTTDDYKTVEVPDTTRPNGNTIILNATSAPVGGNWLVLLKQVIT